MVRFIVIRSRTTFSQAEAAYPLVSQADHRGPHVTHVAMVAFDDELRRGGVPLRERARFCNGNSERRLCEVSFPSPISKG